MPVISKISYARKLDLSDPLKKYKDDFFIPDKNLLYLDGNSLGRPPKAALLKARELLEQQWGERLIRSWNEGWLDLSKRIGDKIAHLIGASPGEVIIADSTSVNLHKLVVAALNFQPDRNNLVSDDLNFPSDIYILQGIIKLLGRNYQLKIIPSEDGIHGPEVALHKAMDAHTALLTLSHTAFKSGYVYDMKSMSHQAHEKGALVLWDLSHSTGAVPVDLGQAHVDMAVGCTYKYLNGGPGAPAFLYVKKELQEKLFNPISGWMGHKKMFDFSMDYLPAEGITQFMTGTPAILSMAMIEPGVDLLLDAGIDKLSQKSQQLTEYFHALWEEFLKDLGFQFDSPLKKEKRGAHVSLSHANALEIDLALIHKRALIPDFRAPDKLRFGMAALYTSFEDVFQTVQYLKEVVENQEYLPFTDQRPQVT